MTEPREITVSSACEIIPCDKRELKPLRALLLSITNEEPLAVANDIIEKLKPWSRYYREGEL